jgi:4-amino-4-deoxy-L-arabinose transferase-like glycosyltransferase
MSRFDRLVPRIDVSHSILLTISRRLTIIVLGDETTLTEDTKRVSMSLGVGLSLGLFCSVELFTVLVCVLIGLFLLCWCECRWWSRDLQSVCFTFIKQLLVALSNRAC